MAGDPFDRIERTESRERSLDARERLADRLDRIVEAMERLDDGSYGTCPVCGEQIAPRRLHAIPEATTCVRCQEGLEVTGARQVPARSFKVEAQTHRRGRLSRGRCVAARKAARTPSAGWHAGCCFPTAEGDDDDDRGGCPDRDLLGWGVDVIFGLPGDGINGIMEALRTRQDRIRFVQVRHEEAAAFMACGYAKFTGRLGVCLATSGPGGIHLLNGLYDAKLDGQPVLAITGMTYHDLIGTHTQQDVDLDRLFMDVASYNERIMGPAHVENVADLACRTALAYRGRRPPHVPGGYPGA